MTLSQQYLLTVSYAIVSGFNNKANATYYYYTSSGYTSVQEQVSTLPPAGVVAVLKYGGDTVAVLPGVLTNIKTLNGNAPNGYPSSAVVTFTFVDTSGSQYTFDTVEVYTTLQGSANAQPVLNVLVAYYSVSPTAKAQDEVVTVTFTLGINQAPSLYVTLAFLYILVPGLYTQIPPALVQYPGIVLYTVSGVNGSVNYVTFLFTGSGFAIQLTLTTNGGGIATINAYTSPLITGTTTGLPTDADLVFSATLPVSLPSTSSPFTYPVAFGIEFETS